MSAIPRKKPKMKNRRTNLCLKLKREAITANLKKYGQSTLWRIIKPPNKPVVVKTKAGLVTSDPEMVLETLTNEFKTPRQHTNLNYDAMLESIRKVIITQTEWEIEPIHESQLAKMIDSLPNKSSTGPDQCSL